MTYRDPAKGDLVRNVVSGRVANVVEVNNKFGWFRVKYVNGEQKQHQHNVSGNQSFVKLTKEETADHYLGLENIGLTNYWSD